jgi:predicted nuclease of predicted toxin-antitoxin system
VPDPPLAFKVDENLPDEVATAFRDAGYEASTARSEGLAGVQDAHVSEVAQREGRVLVTLDVDFGDIRAYPPEEYPGIIVLRLMWQDKQRVLAAIRRVLSLLST